MMKRIYWLMILFSMLSHGQDLVSKAEITNIIIVAIIEEKTNVLQQMKSINGRRSNKLFDEFLTKSDSLLSELNTNENYILDGMNIGYDLESMYLPDTLSYKLDFFKTANILARGTGEGYSELYFAPNYYYQLFKNKVTPDLSEYLRIISIDNQDVYSGDGAFGISWEQLGERILVREKFIKKFPKSEITANVKQELKGYLYDYFFGSDNTATMTTNVFEEWVLAHFKHFARQHPKSKTAKISTNMVLFMAKNKSKELLAAYFENQLLLFFD